MASSKPTLTRKSYVDKETQIIPSALGFQSHKSLCLGFWNGSAEISK